MPYSVSIYRLFINHKSAVIKRKKKRFFILHFSTHEEVEYQAEAMPEPMDINSQQEELKKDERIAALEAKLEQERQKSEKIQNQLTMAPFGVDRFTHDT